MKKIISATVAAACLFSATVAWAAPQDFDIHNRTGQSIMTLQVAPSGENTWGEDILTDDILEDGESGEVTFDRDADACLWDIRVTYEDGDEGDWRQVDLCKTTDIILE
jgi:hypothetical protein